MNTYTKRRQYCLGLRKWRKVASRCKQQEIDNNRLTKSQWFGALISWGASRSSSTTIRGRMLGHACSSLGSLVPELTFRWFWQATEAPNSNSWRKQILPTFPKSHSWTSNSLSCNLIFFGAARWHQFFSTPPHTRWRHRKSWCNHSESHSFNIFKWFWWDQTLRNQLISYWFCNQTNHKILLNKILQLNCRI